MAARASARFQSRDHEVEIGEELGGGQWRLHVTKDMGEMLWNMDEQH